jgi:hypothetical protein
MNLRRIKPKLSIPEEAHALGVSTGTVKRRRRARREKRERDYAARSAGQRNRLRDPATGMLVSYIGQRVRRTRDPISGRFLSVPDSRESNSTEERSASRAATTPSPLEPTPEAVAELVARYPVQPLRSVLVLDVSSFENDARKILAVIARRVLALHTSTTAGVLRMARDAEHYDTAMQIISGSLRVGNAKRTPEPLARELYDTTASFLLCDATLPASRTRMLAREMIRARLNLGIE